MVQSEDAAFANGYNNISVGALGEQISSTIRRTATFQQFSSRGPQLYVGPDGDFGNVRCSLSHSHSTGSKYGQLAFYGGVTEIGNVGGTDPSERSQRFLCSRNRAGTSFAAPVVAGGATLLADVAYDQFAGNRSQRARWPGHQICT